MNKHIAKQIGCGYCIHEKDCKIRDPKINKAALGCEQWEHWQAKALKQDALWKKNMQTN